MTLQPVFAVILARIILKERIKRHFALWACVALIGGYFLTFGWSLPDFSTEGITTVYAALLSLLAAFSFGSSTVFSKKILGNYSFVSSTFFRYGFTTLIMLAIVLFAGHIGDFSQVTPRNWFFIALIGLTTGSGAIFLYYYGLRHVRASLSTFLELMYPITAVVLDYWLDVSMASGWKKPAVELPWNGDVFRSDIATYASMGLRHITTFAVYMDSTYFSTYPSPTYLREYGETLKKFKP